jgi:hypothetical protein
LAQYCVRWGEIISITQISIIMKNAFFLAVIALFISVSSFAQSTVDSIAAKYQLLPMPGPLTIEKTFPVLGSYQLAANAATTASTTTIVDPTVTNTETVTTTAQPGITITLDSASKGIVWVDGLPEGRFKAYLKKSPTTYRIISQKTNLGKQIPEGTLIFDEASNTLNISLGAEFNDADPAAIFATTTSTSTDVAVNTKTKAKKSKSKVTFYTASKVQTEPATQGVSTETSLQQ